MVNDARHTPVTLMLVALLLAGVPVQLTAQEATAFVHVSVVPMSSEVVLEDQTVLVADGRIRAVGPAATVDPPAGATLIDGRGRFLLPGLAAPSWQRPSRPPPPSASRRRRATTP